MPAIDELCARKEPYAVSPEADRLFVEAMREAFAHHMEGCAPFGAFCRSLGFSPEDLREPGDLPRAPFVSVHVFKKYELRSVPLSEVALHLTSSGTTGQKSQTFLDAASLDRLQGMLEAVFEDLGLVERETPANYLLFAYDPEEVGDLGSAFSVRQWTRFAPAAEVFHALHPERFDAEGALAALERFSGQDRPVRIVGFPGFLHRILEALPAPLTLPPESLILTGGGWKTMAGEISPHRLRDEIQRLLGVPPERVRDNFGLVEHGPPYVECEAHAFHVPVYCRALVRHPLTCEVLPDGEVGLLQLMTPCLSSVPGISLLTTDKARLRRGCACGREAPVLELAGRAGIRKHVGCAIAASQLLVR